MRIEKVEGHNYHIGKIDVFDQLHVVLKLAPVLTSLMAAAEKRQKGSSVLDMLAGDVVLYLSRMPREDVEYVLKTCLTPCRREQVGGPLVPLYGSAGLMFEDLSMQGMVELVYYVLQENLGSFFPLGQPSSIEQPV